SIWWVSLGWEGGALRTEALANPATRRQAEEGLRRHLVRAVEEGRSVLAGFDFPYGYPAGFARALGLRGRPWRAAWELLAAAIEDDQAKGWNNRFEVAARFNQRMGGGPFWGHPHGRR